MKKFNKEAFINDLMDKATTTEKQLEVVMVMKEIEAGTHWAVAFDGVSKDELEKKLGLYIPDDWTVAGGVLDYIDVYFYEIVAVLLSIIGALVIRSSLALQRGNYAFGGEIFIPIIVASAVILGGTRK